MVGGTVICYFSWRNMALLVCVWLFAMSGFRAYAMVYMPVLPDLSLERILAILLFGWDRVSPRVHFFSTLMVAFGAHFSAVWIIVANSWQQTPAGSHIVETTVNGVAGQRAEITDFWAVVFNPSTVERLMKRRSPPASSAPRLLVIVLLSR